MTTSFDAAEAFAYVDNCLAPADRRAFEARLREDPELRRRVGLWESQNTAIRAAYGAPASARGALGLTSGSNENFPAWMAAANPSRRNADASRAPGETRSKPARAGSASGPRRSPAARPRFFPGRRVLAIMALAAGLLAAGAPGGPTSPRGELADAGLAAYRAFAASDAPVEFGARDPETLAKSLIPQIGGEIAVPRFSSGALTLVGGRIAPGTTARAAFLVYEDRRGDPAP